MYNAGLFKETLRNGTTADYLRALRGTGALGICLPEYWECVGLDGGPYHDEDVFEHLMLAFEAAVETGKPGHIQLAALVHDLGKPDTAKMRPRKDGSLRQTFYGHEIVGETIVRDLLTRMSFDPKIVEHVAGLTRHHMFFFKPSEVKEKTLRKWLYRVGPELWQDLFLLREADRLGNKKNRDQLEITREIAQLRAMCSSIVESSTATFATDLPISVDEVRTILGPRRKMDAAERSDKECRRLHYSLIGMANRDTSWLEKEKAISYVRRYQ